MEIRKKRVWIRLSEEEYEQFRKKSARFPSMSAMLRRAVSLMDADAATQRIEMVRRLTAFYRKHDASMAMVGNNLNQIAKNLNTLALTDKLTGAYIRDVAMPEVAGATEVMEAVRMELHQTVKPAVR